MRNPNPEDAKGRKKALLKTIILAIFVLSAIGVARFTPIKGYLSPEGLGRLMEGAGVWAPVAYMLVYGVGVCLFLPGTLLTGLGAAIFGPYYGFVYVWIGAMLGAVAAFFIGRTLGREFAASLVGDRLKKYAAAIERNGFATVLYLRLVYLRILRGTAIGTKHSQLISLENPANSGFWAYSSMKPTAAQGSVFWNMPLSWKNSGG